MRGRKPKPVALKIAEGNPGKRKLDKTQVDFAAVAPDCPAHLTPEARKEWKRLVPILLRRRTIREEDEILLTALCEAWAIVLQARAEMATVKKKGSSGLLIKVGSNGAIQVNPLIYLIRDQMSTIHRIAAEFGLSPSARARLTIAPDDDLMPASVTMGPVVDELDALLSGVENDSDDPAVVN